MARFNEISWGQHWQEGTDFEGSFQKYLGQRYENSGKVQKNWDRLMEFGPKFRIQGLISILIALILGQNLGSPVFNLGIFSNHFPLAFCNHQQRWIQGMGHGGHGPSLGASRGTIQRAAWGHHED